MNRMKALRSVILEPYGLASAQYLALLWMSEHEGLIQSDLVTELDSDPDTVSAILRKLEAKQLIERRRGPTDRRAMSLFNDKWKKFVSVIRPQMDRLTPFRTGPKALRPVC
jgi:DNA-binding MarR family transcriptional regulator